MNVLKSEVVKLSNLCDWTKYIWNRNSDWTDNSNSLKFIWQIILHMV